MTRRAGDDLAARSALVGADRLGEVRRVLAREAWPSGNRAYALLAVALRAHAGGASSGAGIADQRRLCPARELPRIVGRKVMQLGFAYTRKDHPFEFDVALAVDVRPHRRDEVLRVLPGEVRASGLAGDPALTVTRGATDGFQVFRTWAMADFAIHFARLGLVDSAHKRAVELCGLIDMALQANSTANEIGEDDR